MTLAYFGSVPDLAIIFIIALVVFGPKKLPEIGKQVGQAMREFRKIADEFTGAVHSVHDEVESVYKPLLTPAVTAHDTSSATVERAMSHQPYHSEPEDLMAPAVPPMPPGPPAARDADAKGH